MKCEDGLHRPRFDKSPPSRAAWIEINSRGEREIETTRRRLHGRRGLKLFGSVSLTVTIVSPPSRAAWIEIATSSAKTSCWACRRLHGRRGLKSATLRLSTTSLRRRLHGRRGLKCFWAVIQYIQTKSPPSRAAWIEIAVRRRGRQNPLVAAFTGGVD